MITGFTILSIDAEGKVAVGFRAQKADARLVARRLSEDGATAMVLAGDFFPPTSAAAKQLVGWAKSDTVPQWFAVSRGTLREDVERLVKSSSVALDQGGEWKVLREGDAP